MFARKTRASDPRLVSTKGHDDAVLPRVLAAAATASSVIYLVAYLWVIDAQNGAIAWWYVVLMVLAALSFAVAAPGTWREPHWPPDWSSHQPSPRWSPC
jgi:hypothetical protein